MKTIELSPIYCPQLKREISDGDCYETRMGISNILEEVGINNEEDAIEICKRCDATKVNPDEI